MKTTKPIAVFDLDDTLVDLKEAVYTSMVRRYGKDRMPHWSQWEYYNVEKMLEISVEEMKKIFIEDDVFKNTKPHLFAKYILRDLQLHGYYVVILTARDGFLPNAYRETEKYLNKNDLLYDELIVSRVEENKMNSLKHFEKIHFTLDDNIVNCENFESSGKVEHVFLHALPHNKSCNKFIRLHNLYQIYPYIGLS